MTKHKGILICSLVILALLIVLAVVFIVNNKAPDVKAFEIDDYSDIIKEFPSEESLGSISDAKELVKKTEELWIKQFGNRVKKEKPYQVFYDEKSGTWLVRGSLKGTSHGGVANILVENDTGRVLALWHDK